MKTDNLIKLSPVGDTKRQVDVTTLQFFRKHTRSGWTRYKPSKNELLVELRNEFVKRPIHENTCGSTGPGPYVYLFTEKGVRHRFNLSAWQFEYSWPLCDKWHVDKSMKTQQHMNEVFERHIAQSPYIIL